MGATEDETSRFSIGAAACGGEGGLGETPHLSCRSSPHFREFSAIIPILLCPKAHAAPAAEDGCLLSAGKRGEGKCLVHTVCYMRGDQNLHAGRSKMPCGEPRHAVRSENGRGRLGSSEINRIAWSIPRPQQSSAHTSPLPPGHEVLGVIYA